MATTTKYNVGNCSGSVNNGIEHVISGTSTFYNRQIGFWNIGHYPYDSSLGRGYLEFNLEAFTSDVTISVANLKFWIGFKRQNNESFVVRNLTYSSACTNDANEFSNLAGGTAINTISIAGSVPGDIKTLNVLTQVNAKHGGRLYLGLIHGSEIVPNVGLPI